MWKSKVKRICLPSYFYMALRGALYHGVKLQSCSKVNTRTIAVDLTGHGKSTIPEDIDRYSMDQQVEDLEELFTELSLDQFILVGYSMGGRVALAYTVRHSKRVSSLILESSSPGLKTKVEREERQVADRQLAERILTDGLPAFIDFWGNIPLFASQKTLSEEKQLAVRNERLSQSEIGLANSLRRDWNRQPIFLLGELRNNQSSGFAHNGGTRHEVRKYFPGNAEEFP